MRIIQKGVEPIKEVTETCHQCKCVFAYTKDDVKWHDDYREKYSYSYVNCPHCQGQIAAKFPIDPYKQPTQTSKSNTTTSLTQI